MPHFETRSEPCPASSSARSPLLELHAGTGRTRLRLRVLRMGDDLCLLLDGGHSAHIGAAALASPQTGDPTVLALPGHREQELAQQLAHSVSQTLHTTVAVLCGIHIDNITGEELEQTLQLAHHLTQTAVHRLDALPPDIPLINRNTPC